MTQGRRSWTHALGTHALTMRAGWIRRLPKSAVSLVTISAIVLQLMFPTTVAAVQTATCSDAFTNNRWRGNAITGGQKHGASSTANATFLNICTSPQGISWDGSFYFSNVTPTTNSHFNDIVQVGYGQCRSALCPAEGHNYYLWSWGRDPRTPGCANFSTVSPLIIGGIAVWTPASHTFGVNHVSNEWRGYVDGVDRMSEMEWSICWTPARAVWFGETLDLGDQLGGTAASPLIISNTTYQNTEGGGFFYTSFNPALECNNNVGTAPYFCDVTSGTGLALWTNR